MFYARGDNAYRERVRHGSVISMMCLPGTKLAKQKKKVRRFHGIMQTAVKGVHLDLHTAALMLRCDLKLPTMRTA